MVLGGNYDRAYSMNISALPSLVQASKNKKFAPIIQTAMMRALEVPPERGIIRFAPVLEENYAINGNTVAGEIEDSRAESIEEDLILNTGSLREGGHIKKKPTKRSLPNLRNLYPPPDMPLPPTPSVAATPVPSIPVPPMPMEKSPQDRKAEKIRTLGRRRSFINKIFGR